jgi:hypothetical protein
MATHIELAYTLKRQLENLFDTHLLVRASVQGNQGAIEFLDQAAIEEAADSADAVMGVRIQQESGHQTLKFQRLSQAGNLEFPDSADDNLEFEKLEFRILTTFMDDQGQEREFALAYDIEKKHYKKVSQGNTLQGNNWLALVTFVNGNFTLLHVRQEFGSDSGDPCGELRCHEDNKTWPTIVNCILSGCG